MSDRQPLTPGVIYEVDYPFVQAMYNGLDEDGPYERMSWKPGVEFKMTCPDDGEMFCDGIGKQILTVVSTHKPGKYPERVFYTRRWLDPAGHEFGKTKLRMTTTSAFRWLTKGYRHPYRVTERTQRLTQPQQNGVTTKDKPNT